MMSVPGIACVCLMVVVTVVTAQKRYATDLEVKYYINVPMVCDHIELNVTKRRDVRSMSWVFPDASTVHSNSDLNPRLFSLSGPDAGVEVIGDRSKFDAYNLTALDIDHEVFGYYTCIVVYNSTDMPNSVIRWGLNTDGADFSEVIETYKDGAIVGGVAAAIFFVLVVGTCIVWHYCFSDNRGMTEVEEEEDVDEMLKKKHQTYANQGYNPGVDATQVEVKVDEPNGYNTKM